MDNSEIYRGFYDNEIIEHEDGTATYREWHYSRKRTAYKKRAKDVCDHTKEEWLRLCEKYNFRCCKCDYEVLGGIPNKDHIIPITIGGSSSIKNIQPLCRNCNTSKSQSIRDYR